MFDDASMEIALGDVVKLQTYKLFGIGFDIAEFLEVKGCSFAAFLDAVANGLFVVDVECRAFEELKQIFICKFQTGITLVVLEDTQDHILKAKALITLIQIDDFQITCIFCKYPFSRQIILGNEKEIKN